MEDLDLVTPTCDNYDPFEDKTKVSSAWHDQWLANYKYETDEAKECKNFIKETYKNDVYLPWAFMERVFYTQDPSAWIDTPSISYNTYEIKTIQNGVETLSTIVSPTIFVQGGFMGKVMSEYYPVQDKDYSAPRAINQNMLNKAYQRAKTRLISRLTGIGWSLYETGDLQFEDDGAKHENPVPTPKVKEVTPKAPKIDITEPQEVKPYGDEDEQANIVVDIINLIKNTDKEKMDAILVNYNKSLKIGYGFEIHTTDSVEVLAENISKIRDPHKFLGGLQHLINA